MKNLGAGPAEKAAQAMKQGDWKKALEEVKSWKSKFAKASWTQRPNSNWPSSSSR